MFLVVFLDQLTKALILHYFSGHTEHSIAVIKNVFHITLVRNTGVAFGLFQKNEAAITLAIFACMVVMLSISLRLHPSSQRYQLAYALVMGGALGNFIDRLRFGYVVDFLDFQVWPVFNVADSAISVGIFLLALFTLREK